MIKALKNIRALHKKLLREIKKKKETRLCEKKKNICTNFFDALQR